MSTPRPEQPDGSPAPQEASTPAAFPAVSIPHGPVDTTLGGTTSASTSSEQLQLPRGALVIMRRSGGLRFRTSATVIFRDGRLAVAGGTHTRPAAVRRISDDEMATLQQLLNAVATANIPASVGRQNPDFFAYEIAMRPRRHVVNLEVFEGSMPEVVEPLVRWLNAAGGTPRDEAPLTGE